MSLKLCLILMVITSCNENFYGKNRELPPPQEEEQIAPAPVFFKTRLNDLLLIEGIECIGTETTEPYGNGSQCLARQYLIYIDNINVCTNGQCTHFEVIPIVGELEDIGARTSGVSIFRINAISPVTEIQTTILNTVHVSSDLNGNGTVFSND